MLASDAAAADNNDAPSLAALDRWNALLGDYNICQPCRAHNRAKTSDGSNDSGGSGSEDSGDYEDGNDGEAGSQLLRCNVNTTSFKECYMST